MRINEFINSNLKQDNNEKCSKCSKKYEDLKKSKKILYKCYCGKNICEDCKESHLKSVDNIDKHNMIDFSKKDFKCCCGDSFEKFMSFCMKCKKNLCVMCSDEHENH